jgi:hypothetical protein
MPDEPEKTADPPTEPAGKEDREQDDAAEFINRQVLEKDTVFFEG